MIIAPHHATAVLLYLEGETLDHRHVSLLKELGGILFNTDDNKPTTLYRFMKVGKSICAGDTMRGFGKSLVSSSECAGSAIKAGLSYINDNTYCADADLIEDDYYALVKFEAVPLLNHRQLMLVVGKHATRKDHVLHRTKKEKESIVWADSNVVVTAVTHAVKLGNISRLFRVTTCKGD